MTRDLVVFGEDFGRHPSSTEHLIRRIAADRRVLWINSIGTGASEYSRTVRRRLSNS